MKAAAGSWRSLDRKLPLLIALVLLATVAAFTASAYQLVQRVLLTAAAERLQGAAAPIVVALSESLRRHHTQFAELARDPAIVEYLASGRGREEARRALVGGWGATLPARGRVELRNAQGVVVLDTVVGPALAGSAWRDSVIGAATLRPGRTLLAPLTREGDDIVGRSLAAVPAPASTGGAAGASDGGATVLGYVVGVRPVTGRGMEAIRALLGGDAAVFIGSPETGAWTDLDRAAAPPASGVRAGASLVYARSSRGAGVGAATKIPGTPWLLWVEQPRAAVLAPMNDLVEKLAILAGLFVLVGAIGAWLLSRRITRPIVALANAADQVSAAPAPATPEPHTRDEVARLTDAFTRMAARVAESTEELEGRVAERTARLEAALRELEIAQQELVKNERLAMLGQLSSAVGHELRNPLGVMTNALYVIEQTLSDGPPLVREYLDLLRGQIAASERIVGDLLDTARVRAPEAEALDLRDFVEAQLHRLGPTAGVTIESRMADNVPAVRMDSTQLSQIVLNLVTNGLQAMNDADGGTLTIEATTVDAGDRVRLSVTDTGPGMQPDVLERIFDPLFTTKARGLGLGLWVSQNLAAANGATLRATSRPGQGATFTLDMPVAVAAATGVA